MADSINQVLNARIGNYVLVRLIGRGTYYSLYQAVDPNVGRMVLIKILDVLAASPLENGLPESGGAGSMPRQESAREPVHVLEARLQREADLLAQLSHPNIIAIYETGELQGCPYLVMEYLYGQPLRQQLDQRPLPLGETVNILAQLADAIDAMHAQGILHRDIRPSNIMILQDKRIKMMDFGFARQPGDTTVTLMGTLVGEPAYMAPEQLRDKPASRETDLWAMGVLLYEMLAGQPPFQGANFPMVAHQVLMARPQLVPNLSPAVQAVLNKALEKDPANRYHQASELVAALRQAVGTRFEKSDSEAPPQGQSRSTRRGVIAGAGAFALAASVATGFFLWHPAPVVPTEELPVIPAAQLLPPTAPPIVPVKYSDAKKIPEADVLKQKHSPFAPAALSEHLMQHPSDTDASKTRQNPGFPEGQP